MNKSKSVSRIAISAVFFSYGLCFASWASRIPSIQQALELSESELGGVLFALPAGSLLSLPISGYLVAKIGSRRVVIISSLLYTLLLTGIGLAPSVLFLIIILFLFGLLGNMLNIAINTQAVGVEAAYGRNIMASFHGMWSLAGFAGAGTGALMIALSIPTGLHYLNISGIAILILLFCFRFLLRNDVNVDKNKPIFSWPDKSLLVLGLIAFCSMMSEGAMFDWSGVYFRKVLEVDKDFIGVGYTAFMVSMAGTRFISDRLVHKFGVVAILTASGCLTAAGLLVAVLFPYLLPSLIGFFIVGIGVSSVVPVVYSLAGKSSVQSPGVALASVSTFGFFGFLIGPPIIGLVAGATDLRISFALIALMGIGVVFLSSRLK